MSYSIIDRAFYEAIEQFDRSEAAQERYYAVMDTVIEREGRRDTVRQRILRVYAMLFCEDIGVAPGEPAGPEDVEATADRLYFGTMGFDPAHWYRMQHHFPVIDEDNYDRFAALVIADLKAGPLRQAALEKGEMLLVGEIDPLHMTRAQRERQKVRRIDPGRIAL